MRGKQAGYSKSKISLLNQNKSILLYRIIIDDQFKSVSGIFFLNCFQHTAIYKIKKTGNTAWIMNWLHYKQETDPFLIYLFNFMFVSLSLSLLLYVSLPLLLLVCLSLFPSFYTPRSFPLLLSVTLSLPFQNILKLSKLFVVIFPHS